MSIISIRPKTGFAINLSFIPYVRHGEKIYICSMWMSNWWSSRDVVIYLGIYTTDPRDEDCIDVSNVVVFSLSSSRIKDCIDGQVLS